jgi:gamma-glutamylcyclotransferase (GGCT)/AIG2-like uncharacterized protein YtfP
VRYFAYGANMDRDAMRERCPGATLLGTERLSGYRFVIARAGYAGLVPDPAADVHGVLWQLTSLDVAALDDFEGVAEGLYRRATLTVAGGPALVYVPADYNRGAPQPGYLEAVIAAARSQGLPDDYIRQLGSWG